MKKLIFLLLVTLPALGQSNSVYNASTYAYTTQVTIGNSATGSNSIGANPTAFAQGIPFLPYNVNASVTLNRNATTAETLTPSAIANCYSNSLTCTLSSSFTYKHVAGESIQSGTFGLQEAINMAVADGSGTVMIDSSWQGPSGSSLITAAKGNSNVMIQDNRNPTGATFYQWNGSAYAATSGGGGGVNPGTQYQLPQYNASGMSVGPSNVTTDSTGNNLTVPGSINLTQYPSPSVSGSIQTAINAAGVGGVIHLLPGASYSVSSTLTMPYNKQILYFDGANITTTGTGDGIYVTGNNVTINDAFLTPGSASTGASIHDGSSLALSINRPRWIQAGSNTPAGGFYWYYGIQVDTDELFTVTNVDGPYGVLHCTASQCGSGIYNPAGSTNAAVGYISNSTISMGCYGNPIDWQGGNDLHIAASILQDYNQFGLRFNWTAEGGDQNVVLTKVHNEAGGCTNPIGGIVSSAGVIMEAGNLVIDGHNIGGNLPKFPFTGTAGSELYHYYVDATNGTNTSVPLLIGYASSASATINGSNSVVLTWPAIAGATAYDIYRVDATSSVAVSPLSVPNTLIASGYTASPVNGAITFTDTVTTPTGGQLTIPNSPWLPLLTMWPGTLVLSSPSGTNPYNAATYSGPITQGQIISTTLVSTNASSNVTLTPGGLYGFSGNTLPAGIYAGGGYNENTPGSMNSALLLPLSGQFQGFGNPLRGMINFGYPNSSPGPTDVITLFDATPGVTIGTPSRRPFALPNDSAICADSVYQDICIRSADHINEYIDHLPDGTSWLEQLTVTAKTFTVPVTAPQFNGTFVGSFPNPTITGLLNFGSSVGQGLCWNGDTSLFRIAAGMLGVNTVCNSGNGLGYLMTRAILANSSGLDGEFMPGTTMQGNVISRDENDAFAAVTSLNLDSASSSDIHDFSNSSGIVAAINIKGTFETHTASNTDQAGILALAGVTTASYTFATTTFTNHPICGGSPDSTNGGWWITYTAATGFTVNFAASYTGNFNYICVPRI